MSIPLNDDLPDVLKTVRTKPMFVMRLDARPLRIVRATPRSYRRIDVVPGGSFAGERPEKPIGDPRLSGTRHYFQARWHNHWTRKNLNLQKFKI